MKVNQLFELECFQDLSKNRYVHPFYKTNKGHLIISGDNHHKNDYILGYILRNIPKQYDYSDLKILMYSLSINENMYPELLKYFKKPIVNSIDQLLSLLIWVKKTMNHRYRLFNKMKVKDIYAFNQKARNIEFNKRTLANLLIIVHEIPQNDDIENKPINDLIHKIVLKSRAAGIHLIITSSTILNAISPVLKYNMDGIIFKVDTVEKAKILIGNDEVTKIESNDVVVYENSTGKKTIYKLFDKTEARVLLHRLSKSS